MKQQEAAISRDEFLNGLRRDGFEEAVTVTREPGAMEMHTHPFEAKALIVSGELSIRTEVSDTQYRVGEIFHLQAEVRHAETYGPQGVTYLVGRKPVS